MRRRENEESVGEKESEGGEEDRNRRGTST